jgi:hypothetical protein
MKISSYLKDISSQYRLKWKGNITNIDQSINSGGFRGGPRGPAIPPFAQNLPSNVSKTQDLIPKIHAFFAILGLGVGPPFSEISGSTTDKSVWYNSVGSGKHVHLDKPEVGSGA